MEIDGGFHLLALEAPNYLLIAHAAVRELGRGWGGYYGKKKKNNNTFFTAFHLFEKLWQSVLQSFLIISSQR